MGTKHYRAMRRTDYLDITAPCRIVILESMRGRVQLLVVSETPPGQVQTGKRGPRPRFEQDAKGGDE